MPSTVYTPKRAFTRGLLRVFISLCLAYISLGSKTFAQADIVTQEKPHPLVILGFSSFPPYCYMKDGKPYGPYLTIPQAVLENQNLNYKIVELPIARLYQGLARGQVHVWVGFDGSPSINGTVTKSSQPINYLHINLYGAKGNKPPAWENLQDTRLITIRGYSYMGYSAKLDNMPTVQQIKTHSVLSAFSMLNVGRAPYVLHYHTPSSRTIRERGMDNIQVTHVKSVPTYVIVSKKAPLSTLLLAKIDQGIENELAFIKEAFKN